MFFIKIYVWFRQSCAMLILSILGDHPEQVQCICTYCSEYGTSSKAVFDGHLLMHWKQWRRMTAAEAPEEANSDAQASPKKCAAVYHGLFQSRVMLKDIKLSDFHCHTSLLPSTSTKCERMTYNNYDWFILDSC